MAYSYITDEQIEQMTDEDLVKSILLCEEGEEYGRPSPCEECPQGSFLRKSFETVCDQYIYKEAARRYIEYVKTKAKLDDDLK